MKTPGFFLELRKLTNFVFFYALELRHNFLLMTIFVLSLFTIQSVAKHSDQIIKLRMLATDSDNRKHWISGARPRPFPQNQMTFLLILVNPRLLNLVEPKYHKTNQFQGNFYNNKSLNLYSLNILL